MTRFEVRRGERGTEIYLDGERVDGVFAYEISERATDGGFARVELSLSAVEVTALCDPEPVIALATESRDLLLALGWTPPGGAS